MSKKPSKFTLPGKIIGRQRANSKRRKHNLPNYSVKELRDWLYDQTLYHILFNKWVASGYKKELAPSCDRKDDTLPYTLDNIQLMTWAENKSKGHMMVRSNELHNPTLLNGGHRAVRKYSLTGRYLHTYISQQEAARDTNVKQGNIHKACNNEIRYTGNFLWRFDDANPTEKEIENLVHEVNKEIITTQRKVVQLTSDLNPIKVFKSIAQAERELNSGKPSNITAVCKGKRNSALGFNWRYLDELDV